MFKIKEYLLLWLAISLLPAPALTQLGESTYYITRKNMSSGLIDKNGKQIIEEQFYQIGCGKDGDHFDIARINEIIRSKKDVVPCFWNNFEIYIVNGKLTIEKNKKTFLVNHETRYHKVADYNEDILLIKAISKKEQLVLLTKEGKLRTIAAFELIFTECNEEGCVYKGMNKNIAENRSGYIDNSGSLKFENDFFSVGLFQGDRSEVWVGGGVESTIIDKSGNYKLRPNEQGYSIFAEFILKYNELKDIEVLSKENTIIKRLNYRHAQVINNEFFMAESLDTDQSTKNECYKYTLFNKKLEPVKELEFNCASMIFKGNAYNDIFIARKDLEVKSMCKKKCYLYMNTKGDRLTDFEFDKASLFRGELARVETCVDPKGVGLGCKEGLINKKFEFVVNYR